MRTEKKGKDAIMILKTIKKVMVLLIAVMMFAGTLPAAVSPSYAAADIAGGTFDGVPWRITSEGELIIGDADAEYVYFQSDTIHVSATPYFPWCDDKYCNTIKSARFAGNVIANIDISGFFMGLENCKTIDLKGFVTKYAGAMDRMFDLCTSLTELDVSGLDTSNVMRMNFMFSACAALKKLDLSNFDTRNVTEMAYIFGSCENLETLNVSGFDTSNVENMHGMFSDCRSLKSIDVSGFRTGKLRSTFRMFAGCYALESLDLSHFDLSAAIETGNSFMLENTLALRELRTPLNLKFEIPLCQEMKDAEGNVYNTLPMNRSDSILLTLDKKADPGSASEPESESESESVPVPSQKTSAKKANPIKITAKTATVKFAALKKKNQTLAVSKVMTIKNKKGKLTFTKTGGNKKITINKKTGKVTVKKGLKKSTYTVTVKVKDDGGTKFKAKTKTVKFKIRVK